MKIKVVYDNFHRSEKWIVWERNMFPKGFSYIQTFTDSYINEIMKSKREGPRSAFVQTLLQDASKEEKKTRFSSKFPTDVERNMNIFEYLSLGIILKSKNVRYNKKKDEFTTCI